MTKNYDYPEADIEAMIDYIRSFDPDNATPVMAILMLENEYAKNHLMSHDNPELLEQIYQDLKNKQDAENSN